MTRFARAKGSKASNERVCEEATSWQEMKNQLVQKKNEAEEHDKRKEIEQRRSANYQKFLKEREEQLDSQTVWAEFPNSDHSVNDVSEKSKLIKKNKIHNKKVKRKQNIDNVANLQIDNGQVNNSTETWAEESCTNLGLNSSSENNELNQSLQTETKIKVKSMKEKKKLTKKIKVISNVNVTDYNINNAPAEISSEVKIDDPTTKNQVSRTKVIDIDSLPENEKKIVLKKRARKIRQIEKRKLKKLQLKQQSENTNEQDSISTKQSSPVIKAVVGNRNFEKPMTNYKNPVKNYKNKFDNKLEKKNKIHNKQKNEEHNKRDSKRADTMIIHGKTVEIRYYDGFPIKREDAQNLNQLKKDMISRGLPRSEIDKTLKLERRRAEKALVRERKKVCFNCRKFGHNFAECPQLLDEKQKGLVDSSGTGICFKCGSTEHTSFGCRVVDGQNFKFATCFICNEQGHISKQCPDNARGLYPKGGSCRVCGDVTHLKKDCPQFQMQQEKEQSKFQVQTLDARNLEDIDEINSNIQKIPQAKNEFNKIIKF